MYSSLENLLNDGYCETDAVEFEDFFQAEEFAENGPRLSQEGANGYWVVCSNGISVRFFTTVLSRLCLTICVGESPNPLLR